MAKRNSPQAAGKHEVSIIRSSAAEYLTFVAASGQGGVEAVYADESIWLTQKMMGVLYDVETQTITPEVGVGRGGITRGVVPNRHAAGIETERRKAFPQGLHLAGTRFQPGVNDSARDSAQ